MSVLVEFLNLIIAFTNGELKNLHIYYQDVFFFVVVKLVYSILLLRVILRTFRRNLKFRGGRSPFRMTAKTSDSSSQVESGSPQFKKKKEEEPHVWVC